MNLVNKDSTTLRTCLDKALISSWALISGPKSKALDKTLRRSEAKLLESIDLENNLKSLSSLFFDQ